MVMSRPRSLQSFRGGVDPFVTRTIPDALRGFLITGHQAVLDLVAFANTQSPLTHILVMIYSLHMLAAFRVGMQIISTLCKVIKAVVE